MNRRRRFLCRIRRGTLLRTSLCLRFRLHRTRSLPCRRTLKRRTRYLYLRRRIRG